MANMIGGVLSLVLSITLVVSVIVPTVKNANTTGWDSAETTDLGAEAFKVAFSHWSHLSLFLGLSMEQGQYSVYSKSADIKC